MMFMSKLCKNEAPQYYDKADLLHLGKTKLCRILHRFGMIILLIPTDTDTLRCCGYFYLLLHETLAGVSHSILSLDLLINFKVWDLKILLFAKS